MKENNTTKNSKNVDSKKISKNTKSIKNTKSTKNAKKTKSEKQIIKKVKILDDDTMKVSKEIEKKLKRKDGPKIEFSNVEDVEAINIVKSKSKAPVVTKTNKPTVFVKPK